MKTITLNFTPEELRELAKQLHMASYFLIYCDGYDNQQMVDEIYNRVCEAGFEQALETGAFRHGGFTETKFTITRDVDQEAETIIEVYNDEMVTEHVPYALADRDFNEKYGELYAEKILANEELLNEIQGIQNFYKEEWEKYGVLNLRLEKKHNGKPGSINEN